jgi:hypothetical protein
MQQQRHGEFLKTYAPDGSHLEADQIYWKELAQKDINALCNFTFFDAIGQDRMQFQFLNERVQVDIGQRCLLRHIDDSWQISDDPLLTLATIMYLNNITGVYPLGKDIVGIKDLKEGHFFTGPHELCLSPLLERYGDDLDGFRRTGTILHGNPMEMADAAFRLLPFPRLPLYYLLWVGDVEFKPRIQVLVDRSIEKTLPADAIWALINRVSAAWDQ